MSNENKRNIQYFEASSMRELFESMQIWQKENNERFLSISIENDNDTLCCIALLNPTEVIIKNGFGSGGAYVKNGDLSVMISKTA